MAYSLVIALLVLMVHAKATGKPRRSKESKTEEVYMSEDNTESETESEDWKKYAEEVEKSVKGKSPILTKSKSKASNSDKGKAPMEKPVMKKKCVARKRTRASGVEIQEPSIETILRSDRIKDFENRECIGERHVNVRAFKERSRKFGALFDRKGLAPICSFEDPIGYCLHLIRTFYQNASTLVDLDNGTRSFTTSIRNTKLKITPQLIGEVLGMSANSEGTHYMKANEYNNTTWRKVVDGICELETMFAGNSVFSKELRTEFRFLNFVVCYNIIPNMNTKVLRWDRMLFLYFLGHSESSPNSNFNIPFIIWSRMARYVEGTHSSERLPFPLIIMRILQKFNIDIGSTSYLHSLGTINDTTVVKSLSTKQDDAPTPPRSKRATAEGPSSRAAGSSPDESISVTSIYQQQQRISSEQERMSSEFQTISSDIADLKKSQSTLTKLVKKVLRKLGCSSSEDSD